MYVCEGVCMCACGSMGVCLNVYVCVWARVCVRESVEQHPLSTQGFGIRPAPSTPSRRKTKKKLVASLPPNFQLVRVET